MPPFIVLISDHFILSCMTRRLRFELSTYGAAYKMFLTFDI